MKSNRIIFLFLFFICAIAFESHAQNRIGGGLGWGSEVQAGGVGINGEFFLNRSIAAAPGFIFFFDDWWELNLNGNFVLTGTDAVALYGLAGLNFNTTNSQTGLAANLGLGSNFDLGGNLRPFVEVKYTLGENDQLVLFGGIKFPIRI